MSYPLRKQVRDALYTRIITSSAFSAANTFKGRKYPGDAITSLPAAVIYFESEDRGEDISMGPTRSQEMTIQYNVQVYSGKGTHANTDEALDALTKQIEDTFTDRTLGGIAFDCRVMNVSYDLNAESDDVYGIADMGIQIEVVNEAVN
jgi:hypothetical protein